MPWFASGVYRVQVYSTLVGLDLVGRVAERELKPLRGFPYGRLAWIHLDEIDGCDHVVCLQVRTWLMPLKSRAESP